MCTEYCVLCTIYCALCTVYWVQGRIVGNILGVYYQVQGRILGNMSDVYCVILDQTYHTILTTGRLHSIFIKSSISSYTEKNNQKYSQSTD